MAQIDVSEKSGSLHERDANADDEWRLRQAILACCPSLRDTEQAKALNLDIHSNDQMFTHSLLTHQDEGAALSQYFNVAVQQYNCARQILDALFPPSREGERDIEVLDFACGYGRLLRFLVHILPRSHIYASELQPDALEFVARTFGVATLTSYADPALFNTDRRFDFIWVASLFTHLPEPLYRDWLGKLYSLLSPRGVLCFSARDEVLLPPGQALPESGILYQVQSENAGLSAEIYGTTYASEGFVSRVLKSITGNAHPYFRLPRALANEQDLYLIAKDPARDFHVLNGFKRGSWGWVDRRRLSPSGELYLEGWAGSLDAGAAQVIDIAVDDIVHRVTTGIARPDVSAVFNDPHLADAGWKFRLQLPEGTSAVRLAIITGSASNSAGLLYVGTLAAT